MSDRAVIVRGVAVPGRWSVAAVALHVREAMPPGVQVSACEQAFAERVEVTLHVPWWRVRLRRRKHGLMVAAGVRLAELPVGQMAAVRWG